MNKVFSQSDYLKAMGVPLWQQRPSAIQTANVLAATRQVVMQCQACLLHQSRTHPVFGVGNENAKLMLIGEAPGFYEDQQGEPFVGRAGQLLNAMLQSIGLSRQEVYIANIIKCRPPNNRDPLPEEVQQCTPFLEKQIAFIRPQLLVALGRVAAHFLLDSSLTLAQLRNKLHFYGNQKINLIVTYHPAYLLRQPADKAKAWQDWQKIMTRLADITK